MCKYTKCRPAQTMFKSWVMMPGYKTRRFTMLLGQNFCGVGVDAENEMSLSHLWRDRRAFFILQMHADDATPHAVDRACFAQHRRWDVAIGPPMQRPHASVRLTGVHRCGFGGPGSVQVPRVPEAPARDGTFVAVA